MKTFREVYAELRKNNRKNYFLLVTCNVFSVMLITAYVSMMQAPTVLSILPEGGDSRKQVMAIFVLAIVGCGMFTTYAASLFFRFKSRETGVFMALGASRSQVRSQLFRELAIISVGSCLVGILLGIPFAWCIWQFFRFFVVDTKEMLLIFDPQAYLFAGAFSVFIIVCLFTMGIHFIRRTNIIDIVNEQRKSEPIRDVKRWYGWVGIVLIFVGGFGGYITPTICVQILHWYPPAWINITYLPLFFGIYMVLLHTVVRGWRGSKNRYKHIITRSIMKFQGRQTVRNMLVITVLLAGAYFAAFYTPMLGTGTMLEIENRPIDYSFHYRSDQKMLTKATIQQMANEENVVIISWKEADFANLGHDGQKRVYDSNGKFHYEYRPLIGEGNYISESDYSRMSGQNVNIQRGKFGAVLHEDGTGEYMITVNTTSLTNMVTRQTLDVTFQEYLGYDMMATKYYVLDDADYAAITTGLTDEWRERLVYFNVENVMDTYPFAKRLYNAIVNHSGPQCELPDYYDRVAKIVAQERGETYWGDTNSMTKLSYAKRDSADFKMYWRYAPQFRVLDRNDFVANVAVFLMLFVFIAVICFAAVLVIAYTRCLTIALNNQQVYNDLRHLGANRRYLYRAARSQISKVYNVPAVVGTSMIYALYAMIMYFNDNQLTAHEIAGLFNCLLLVVAMSLVLYGFYRFTLRKVCRLLKI